MARGDARLLVVGSMPGVASLAARRYYAHPRNAFWPILGAICGFEPTAPYARRLAALRAAGIALWDVVARCRRPGSGDGDICPESVETNDFAAFLACHPRIRAVFCNGTAAHDLYRRRVRPSLPAPWVALPCLRLPSTSPAHASRSPGDKLAAWRAALSPLLAAGADQQRSTTWSSG